MGEGETGSIVGGTGVAQAGGVYVGIEGTEQGTGQVTKDTEPKPMDVQEGDAGVRKKILKGTIINISYKYT